MSQALFNDVRKLEVQCERLEARLSDLQQRIDALEQYIEDNFARKRGPRKNGEHQTPTHL